jgi:hypothetical protein
MYRAYRRFIGLRCLSRFPYETVQWHIALKEQVMNQQEFEPGSQSNQQNSLNEDDEIQHPQYPYSWSGTVNAEAVPRDEPPSSYDATVMQQGYQAQTSSNASVPGASKSSTGSRYEYVAPEGDGDAYEHGYRPNNAYNARQNWQGGTPPWARPQPHPRNPARFAFILLVLLGVTFLMAMFGAMGDIFGPILLGILFVIMVPLLILFVIFGIIFRMLRPRHARYWRRGPWW